MIYMFLSNNPSSGDINSSNLSCLFIFLFRHFTDVETFVLELGTIFFFSKFWICLGILIS